jgi:hypothetical protein
VYGLIRENSMRPCKTSACKLPPYTDGQAFSAPRPRNFPQIYFSGGGSVEKKLLKNVTARPKFRPPPPDQPNFRAPHRACDDSLNRIPPPNPIYNFPCGAIACGKQRALIRPVGHLLPFASERAKAHENYRLLPCSCMGEGGQRPDEGSFFP